MMLHLVRDVLDKPLVDRRDGPMGRVDGLVIELSDDGEAPRVARIECGFPVLARRIHPRIAQWVRALGERFGVRRGRTYRISWSRVKSIKIEIKLDLDADKTPALAWERWLRERVVRYVPWST
jgi:hypothetical protein